MLRIITILMLLLIKGSLWADSAPPIWYSQSIDKTITLNIELYLSSTCPHCHKADAFFQRIVSQTPWIHVTRYIINEDKQALIRFNQMLEAQKMGDFSVPSFFFCNSRWIGFDSDETTGKDIMHALNYCRAQIKQHGRLTDATSEVLKHRANANVLVAGMTETPTALYYIVVVGLLDAYNPCALFSLMGFFAFLFLLPTRKQKLVVGLAYLLTIGSVHYMQQVAPNVYFELLSHLRIPAVVVGILGLCIASCYIRWKIACRSFLFIALLIAFMTHMYQQTCVMNWSYLFEQWLHHQHISAPKAALLQMAYQIMYFLPQVLTLILYLYLVTTKRFIRYENRLSIIGLLILVILSLLLLFSPELLSRFSLSLLILLFVALSGWLTRAVDKE
jgi:glutaredoxin